MQTMKMRSEFREDAAANCVLRDGSISVFSLHSVHETAPFYLNELYQHFETRLILKYSAGRSYRLFVMLAI